MDIRFSVADMRGAFDHHGEEFDVVLACDNAVPHLLSDDEIRAALAQLHRCTRPGGLCLISLRDYAAPEIGGTQVKPYGVRTEGGARDLLMQVWDFQGEIYDQTMYLVEDRGGAQCRTRAMRSRYYAIPIDRLMGIFADVGFTDVRRLDGEFFQPVIIGMRPD